MEIAVYFLALSFGSSDTILPAFVLNFTDSSLIIGSIPFLSMLGYVLPQILGARYALRLEQKKTFVICGSLGERFPWLILAIALYFFAETPVVMIALFLFCYSLISLSIGVTSPAWLDLLAKIIPERRRGRLYGLGFSIGGALGILGSLAAGSLLEQYAFPDGYMLCFFFAFLFNALSWASLTMIKEPKYPVKGEMQSLGSYVSSMLDVLRNNSNFCFYLLARVLLSFYGMAAAFFTVEAITRFNATNLDVGIFTALMALSRLATNYFWGFIADKKGHKITLVSAAAFDIVAILVAALANSLALYYIVFVVHGAVISVSMISGFSIILEFADAENRPTYVALNNLVIYPIGGLASLLGGFLAGFYDYRTIFMMTTPLLTSGLIVMLLVKDPRFVQKVSYNRCTHAKRY